MVYVCSVCQKSLAPTSFNGTQLKRAKKGGKAQCRTCISDADIKRKYPELKNGIKDKAELCKKAQNKCEICAKQLDNAGPESFIDHNHETNKVRGILCHSCNVAIGHLEDNPVRMAAAIRYVVEKDGVKDDDTSEELANHMASLEIKARRRPAKKQ